MMLICHIPFVSYFTRYKSKNKLVYVLHLNIKVQSWKETKTKKNTFIFIVLCAKNIKIYDSNNENYIKSRCNSIFWIWTNGTVYHNLDRKDTRLRHLWENFVCKKDLRFLSWKNPSSKKKKRWFRTIGDN